MCGFVGYYGDGDWDRGRVVEEMKATIAHRGPDSDGTYTDETVSLGFRRLSIIDLDKGSQPMHSSDERYVIVFNGEIYNYRELRKELVDTYGDVFLTDSDTEVLLAAYRRYGTETASKLRGMFAFVIYDKEEKKLYGARDYFGIKPFYYATMGNVFLFGSEIKGFLAHPAFSKKVDPEALKMYLVFQYSPLEKTLFQGVYKLLPGTWFTYQNGEMNRVRYFEPSFEKEERNFDDAVKQIDAAVLQSVEYHQIADVEVGAFLSGGVDSSYVASTVKPMKTFSVGFAVQGFDETNLAADLSKKLGMTNAKKEITPDEFFEAIPMVQYHSDEPHANLSAVPLYYLANLASEELKVVLSGEGADELFGGYDWYIQSDASVFYKKLPLKLRRFLAATLGKIPQRHIKRFFVSNAQRVEDAYIGQAFIMNDEEANSFLSEKYRCSIGYRDVTGPYYEKVKDADDLTKKMYLDMHLWLPHDILLKADKMTMAHSLELRVPYLDREVWKVARTLSTPQRMKGRMTKRAFRSAALSHIPEDWANRKKAGFMVPFRVWIRDEKYARKVRDVFKTEYAAEFFDREKLLRLLEDHVSGKTNNARKIYTIYAFLLWYEQYFIQR